VALGLEVPVISYQLLAMPNFIIGIIAGAAFAVLFGWIGKNTGEFKQLRDQVVELKSANQQLMSQINQKTSEDHRNRALAQPARPIGGSKSSGSCN